MQTSQFQLPDSRTLAFGIASILNPSETNEAQIKIIERQFNQYTSTFPSDIVTCRLADETEIKLFCKYGAKCSRTGDKERGGIAYEAMVYRQVLQPLSITRPEFYGLYSDASAGQMWLVLEYLKHKGHEMSVDDVTSAARWVGQFHRRAQEQFFRYKNIFS